MHTRDIADDNMEKIAALFPECITETTDDKGNTRKAIDFEKLKDCLGQNIADPKKQTYEFLWPDKDKAKQMAAKAVNSTLRPCRDESVDFDNTQNLYIEGDNLEVLKLLRETYLNKVKMIYIDPPYNTGNDFIYRDNYNLEEQTYLKAADYYDEQGNRLESNKETKGRYHTDWLNMMYPRLKVARDLLTEDGVIFISIDDHELANLKMMCDEIFGEDNFVGQLIVETATDNNPSQINTEHEYMLCFCKSIGKQDNWQRQSDAAKLLIEKGKELLSSNLALPDAQKELRKWIKLNKTRLPQISHYNNIDKQGIFSSSSNSSNPHPGGYVFDIIHPKTGLPCPKPINGWRWPKDTFDNYVKNNQVVWGKDHTTQPHIKKYIETSTEYLRSLIYEDNRKTTKALIDIFNGKVFENPKPTTIISKIIDFTTNKNSLILDFFSGSATTAHAVMQLNAEDGGKRRFIMVQVPEKCAEGSEAAKAGYKTICEIGKERIRRAGKKILQSLKNQNITPPPKTKIGSLTPVFAC